MAYFPMYVDIENKDCLIVGGGKVALRKVEVLLDFGAKVTLVAEKVCVEIESLTDSVGSSNLVICKRAFREEDIIDKTLVVTATDDHQINHEIAQLAKEKKIPVNAVDQTDDCTFIFPAYVKENDLVAAFSSSGKSPVTVQYLKEKERDILTPFLGEISDYLGSIREEVKLKYKTEAERKAVYRAILEEALASGSLPDNGNK